jgi:predicted nucleic acid-binding protein
MILVDTSVWIELLSSRRPTAVREEHLLQFVTCAPLLQEVLQGLRPGPVSEAFRESLLALPILSNPMPLELYLAAADIYGQGRRKGFTIRSTVDCLIAAIAIENRARVWHRDRDFEQIARYTALEAGEAP